MAFNEVRLDLTISIELLSTVVFTKLGPTSQLKALRPLQFCTCVYPPVHSPRPCIHRICQLGSVGCGYIVFEICKLGYVTLGLQEISLEYKQVLLAQDKVGQLVG